MANTEALSIHTRQRTSLAAMASNGMIPQAILFTGIHGIGKAHTAKWFFTSLFCTGPSKPCGSCPACIQIKNGTFPDLIEIRPNEKGTIPIGDQVKKEPGSIRWLIDRLAKKSVYGRTGVIIKGMDAVTIEGQNALLKTIEEPHEGVHIILTVSNRSNVIKTILSRCRIMAFNPLSDEELSAVLINKYPGKNSPDSIVPLAGGSVSYADILLDDANHELISGLCSSIKRTVSQGAAFDNDLTALLKGPGSEPLIAILLNIYRLMLMDSIYGTQNRALPEEIIIHETASVKKIIKILLALKKGLTNNLNIKIALKGMLYAHPQINETIDADIASILNK